MAKKESMFDKLTGIFEAVMFLSVLGFAFVIVLGNLAGSSGFTAGGALANITDGLVLNVTQGVSDFFGNAPAWFNLLSVVVILGIIFLVIRRIRMSKDGGRDDIV